MSKLVLTLSILLVACGNTPGEPYTLYRDSPLYGLPRMHVATFDADFTTKTYNMENCQIVQKLFQDKEWVTDKYWCEKGIYKK